MAKTDQLIPREEALQLAGEGLGKLKDSIQYGTVVGKLPRWEGTDRAHTETGDVDLLVVPGEGEVPELPSPYNVFKASPEDVEPQLMHWLSGKAIIGLKLKAKGQGYKLNRYGLQTPDGTITDADKIYELLGAEMPAHVRKSVDEWRGRPKAAALDVVTGQMGSGKSTLAKKLRDKYDIVEGTDLGSVVGDTWEEPKPEDKPRLRQEKSDRLLGAHRAGKRVLVEGYPPGIERIPGITEEAERLMVLDPGLLTRLWRVAGRSRERGTSMLDDVPFALSIREREQESLDRLRELISEHYTIETSEEAEKILAEVLSKKAARSDDSYVRIRVTNPKGQALQHHFVRANKWGLPSGIIESGESPRDAAARELLERTGYKVNPKSLSMAGKDEQGFHLFETSSNSLTQVAKPGEMGGYKTKIKWGKEKTAAVVTKEDIHNLADDLNIPWDDDPDFKAYSERVTGKTCLDKMTPPELEKLKKSLKGRGRLKTALESPLYHGSSVEGIEEFAPGIPADRKIHDLPTTQDATWRLALQLHKAHKAGPHWDLRLVDPESGQAHSWAVPKRKWPTKKNRLRLAVMQPTHTSEYSGWQGTIPKGTYGAGKVKLLKNLETSVSSSPDKVIFNVPGKGDMILRRTDANKWMLLKAKKKAKLTHPEQRLKERTTLPAKSLSKLKAALRGSGIVPPKGVHHIKLDGKGYAVVKNVKNKPIIASFLTSSMIPPGQDLTARVGRSRIESAIKQAGVLSSTTDSFSPEAKGALVASGAALPIYGVQAALGKSMVSAPSEQVLRAWTPENIRRLGKELGPVPQILPASDKPWFAWSPPGTKTVERLSQLSPWKEEPGLLSRGAVWLRRPRLDALAHEMGHATMLDAGKFEGLRRALARVSGRAALYSPLAGGLAALGMDSDSPYAWAPTIATGALQLPTLGEEAVASTKGLGALKKMLEEGHITPQSFREAKKWMGKGYSSYLLGALAGVGLPAAITHYKKKENRSPLDKLREAFR